MVDPANPSHPDAVAASAVVTLFGFPPAEVVVSVLPRSHAWRVGGAFRRVALFTLLAPVVAIVPPHAPWAIGALAGGVVLARRRLKERYTLVSMTGSCPKCGEALAVKSTRLREPHPVTCEACHHVGSLQVPAEALLGGLAQDR